MRCAVACGLLCVALLAGCGAAEGDVDQSQVDDLTEAGTLRPVGPAQRLVSGEWLRDQVLHHSVVDVDVSLSGLLSAQIDVSIPPDFWAEVAGYFVTLEQDQNAHVTIDGPRVAVLVRRIGAPKNEDRMIESSSFDVLATAPGDHLLMVVPLEIEPGADHIAYDIKADLTLR